MEEKRYLKWYNVVGYGTGDIAGNVVYAFLSSFVMIYLTNTVGLNKYSYMVAIIGRLLVVVAGYMGSVPLILLFTAVAALEQGPWQEDINAVIASCSEYTYILCTFGCHS